MQQVGFHPKSQPNRRNQCGGSGMFIPDPHFFPSQIPDPNFFHPGPRSRIRIKEFKYFKFKFFKPKNFLPIPDPGVKKAPDPIRNTVRNTRFIVEHRFFTGLRNYCKLCFALLDQLHALAVLLPRARLLIFLPIPDPGSRDQKGPGSGS